MVENVGHHSLNDSIAQILKTFVINLGQMSIALDTKARFGVEGTMYECRAEDIGIMGPIASRADNKKIKLSSLARKKFYYIIKADQNQIALNTTVQL